MGLISNPEIEETNTMPLIYKRATIEDINLLTATRIIVGPLLTK